MTAHEWHEHYRRVRERLNAGTRERALDRKAVPREWVKVPARPPVIAVVTRPEMPKSKLRAEISLIVRKVVARTGISQLDIMGPSRIKRISRARQRLAYALHQHFGMDRLAYEDRPHGMSLMRLAGILGGRDHTTILHAIRREAERRRAARSH